MFTDYVLNGQAHGEVGGVMSAMRYDPNLLRPYEEGGRQFVTVNTGQTKYNEKQGLYVPVFKKMLVTEAIAKGIPVVNTQTTLRKDEWLMFDRAVLRASRQRLRAWSDMASANSFGGFDGMSKMVLEHERMTDVGEAMVDMEGISEGNDDTPHFQLEGLPLPITHSSFTFSKRRLAVSRNGGIPLDATMAEMAGRRVAEKIEKTLIGVDAGINYGDATRYDNAPKVYGYTNHPDRITSAGGITTPTSTNSSTTLAEVLAMRDLATAQNFFGPFMLYHTSDWDQFMDTDYGKTAGIPGANAAYGFAPSQTLRQRLQGIEGIQGVRRLDFWTDTTALLLVQMTSDVVRAVNGMSITTVQWETKGGMQLNFKVMAIMVPQIRSLFIGTDQTNAAAKCGIVHATV